MSPIEREPINENNAELPREDTVTPERVAIGSEALEHVLVAELVALAEPYQRWSRLPNEVHVPEPRTVEELVATFPNVRAAFPMLERFVRAWNDEMLRARATKELAARVATGIPEQDEDDGMINWRIAYVIGTARQIIDDEIEREAVKPFEELLAETNAVAARPDSPERRAARALIEQRLTALSKEREMRAKKYSVSDDDEPWTYDPGQELIPRSITFRSNLGESECEVSLRQITTAIRHLHSIRFDEMVSDSLTTVDLERVRAETLLYGAKSANLREMARVLPSIQQLLQRNYVDIAIPRFESIPISTYDHWKAGDNIDPQLRSYHEWIGGKAVYVRSSAVYSEDNDGATGAGIYHSEQIPAGADFDELKAAVLRVYESVDSDAAREYRERIGVPAEKMGITLQDAVNEEDYSEYTGEKEYYARCRGFINTSRAYAPNLADVVSGEYRDILVKDAVRERIASGSMHLERDSYYFQNDAHRRNNDFCHTQDQCAMLAYYLERAYGIPVQCEFVSDGKQLNIVQTRILPEAHRTTANVEFPAAEPILTRDATGVMDDVLDILPHSDRNSGKKGLVVFLRSYFTGEVNVDRFFPKEGAVLVLAPSQETGGHIETLCVERGLTCLFQSDRRNHAQRDPDISYGSAAIDWDERLPNVVALDGLKRVRIVSNGLEARIYAPDRKD